MVHLLKTGWALAHQGLTTWLDHQLALPADDAGLTQRLKAARLLLAYEAERDREGHSWPARKEMLPYQYLSASGDKLLPLIDYETTGMSYEERIRPAREVQAASLIRAVHAPAQLREVMTQFWHDHFNVNSMRDEHTGAYFGLYDTLLRKHALGNFRKLLGDVTRSGAMLYYLNNDASRASPANENFARELLELHTLGAMHYHNDVSTNWHDVPGAAEGLAQGYIDQDVYEAARALTGWSFGDGRWISEGEFAPRTGEFHYIDRWHDPYQKRILAVEFRANAGPMEDGEGLLDLLSSHPSTARFLCGKICRRLVADDPPDALIAKAVSTWLSHVRSEDQIAQVVRTIVLSPEFLAAKPQKLKRPFEFLASYYRTLGAEVPSPSLNFVWSLARAGWMQHEFRPPTGHPDVSESWANTAVISTYVDVALSALEDWSEAGQLSFSAFLPESVITIAGAYQHIHTRMTGTAAADEIASSVAQRLTEDANALLPEKQEDRSWILKGLIAAASLTPQFLYR